MEILKHATESIVPLHSFNLFRFSGIRCKESMWQAF